MQYKVTTMRRQMEYVHPSQHTIPGTMRRQTEYVHPRHHAIQGTMRETKRLQNTYMRRQTEYNMQYKVQGTNRIRTSETTWYNEDKQNTYIRDNIRYKVQ